MKLEKVIAFGQLLLESFNIQLDTPVRDRYLFEYTSGFAVMFIVAHSFME